VHVRPRLNAFGRTVIVERFATGWSAARLAKEFGVSRATIYYWWHRYQAEGLDGLADRPSRPKHSPRRLDPKLEAQLTELRRKRRLGPHRMAALSGVPRSTCYKVLRRHQLNRLDCLDRASGRLIRRYEMTRPGELGHMDVKKLARIPEGGGHRLYGRQARPRRDKERLARVGYDCLHSLVDDYSRLAYSEVLGDETAQTCGDFVGRAFAWFAEHGVRFEAVMTDNAWSYRNGNAYRQALARIGAKAKFTPPYTPRVNGKVERFNRTLLEEWECQLFVSNEERRADLPAWLHLYNFHRAHTAVGGPPIQRVSKVCGNYSPRGRDRGSSQLSAGWVQDGLDELHEAAV
jgi:transposase